MPLSKCQDVSRSQKVKVSRRYISSIDALVSLGQVDFKTPNQPTWEPLQSAQWHNVSKWHKMKLGHSLPIPDPTFSTRKNFSTLFNSQRRTNCSDSKLHNRASQPAYSMPIACGRRWRTSPRRLKPGRSNDQKDSISLVSTFFSFAPSFLLWVTRTPHAVVHTGQKPMQRTWKA